MANQLYEAIEAKGYLSPNQYGFRRGGSSEQAASALTRYIAEANEDGQFCAVVFCDITKPFDTVDHEKLLNKI